MHESTAQRIRKVEALRDGAKTPGERNAAIAALERIKASERPHVKNPAAVELGRKGGKARVPKGFGRMSKRKRSAAGKAGAAKRWGK